MEIVDENLKNFLKTWDQTGNIAESYQQYLSKANSANAKFAASLKSIAANMAIMLAVNVAIKAAEKLWDTLNVTVEEQGTKISELKTSYEGLKNEYDELSQKQDITDAEKNRLDYLERRLELDERILKAEQAQLFDEKTGSKFTDLFDKDNLHTQYLGEMNYRNKDGYAGLKFKYNNTTEDITKVQDQISEWKKLQTTVEEGSKAWDEYQKRIDHAQNKETKYIDQLSEQENQLTINLGKYADNIEYLQSQLDGKNLTEEQTATAKEQLSQWQKMYDTVELMITEIRKLNGTYDDSAEQIAEKYIGVLNRAKTYLGGYDYSKTGTEATNETGRSIQDFWNENILSGTEEEIAHNVALWQKVTEGITDAALAMDAYTKAKKNARNTVLDGSPSIVPTLSSSIQQIAAQLEPQFAKLGEAYQSIFTAGGFTLSNADNSMLDGLRQSFAEIEESIGVTFDPSKLESFFDALTSDYADSEEGAKQVQQAFNGLATAYFYSTETLEHLNEETAESIAKQLEEMGVANAQEVVYGALNEKTQELALEKQFLAETGKEVADATRQDIDEFLKEATTSGDYERELTALALKKAAVNGVLLDTSADITNLLSLAQSAGIATENLSLLARAKSGLALAESQGNEAMVSYYTDKIEELGKKAQEDIFHFGEAKLDFKGAGSAGKSGGSSASSAGSKDTHKEAYDTELKELERLHKLGAASDEEYWKTRLALNEKFFGESSGMHETYLEEYRKNEEDILEGIKKLWEDYYTERKDNLKGLISYAEKLYDKEIDSLESDIKALEEKRDAEKSQWQDKIDAIGDEIDALEEANDERERAIDLQNKQWALQKAMRQRTILLYSEDKGMHYAADDKAVRDSQNALDSAEHDSKVAGLKKQQDDLEEQLDAVLETYDSQIEAIEKQIASLKEVKTAWSDIAENQEFTELEEKLKSLFGGGVKEQILNGSTAFMDSIVSQYSDASAMLRTIEEATLTDIQNMLAQYGALPENLMPITDTVADITNIIGTVDTSGFNTSLDNTAQSSANAAEKIQSAAAALNSLSNEVTDYQLPTLNADNFMSAFSEEGGILGALNGFMERYKEICGSIPGIWDDSLAEAFGQGGGSGDPAAGGLPNDTKYGALFSPVLAALDTCRLDMQAKLKECLETFTAFQADLSAVIGVGTGSAAEPPKTEKAGTGGKAENGASAKKADSKAGSGTIVGAIREGGALIEEALNGEEDSWSASFTDAKDSIHETAISIVECIESMAEEIVNSCIAAIEAINMLEIAQGGSGSHPAPPPYSRAGHSHAETGSSFYAGTGGLPAPEKNALLSEYGQPEMAAFPDGRHKLYTKPTLADLPKGTVIYNERQTEKLLREKERIAGTAPAAKTQPGTPAPDKPKSFPIQPGDRAWELMQKAQGFLAAWQPDSVQPVSNAVFAHQKQMEALTNRIDHINNIQSSIPRPGITIGDINITCPGVTSREVARQIGVEVNHLFNGMHLDAMQHNIGR